MKVFLTLGLLLDCGKNKNHLTQFLNWLMNEKLCNMCRSITGFVMLLYPVLCGLVLNVLGHRRHTVSSGLLDKFPKMLNLYFKFSTSEQIWSFINSCCLLVATLPAVLFLANTGKSFLSDHGLHVHVDRVLPALSHKP